MLNILQEWTDERLTWDPQKYSNLSDIVVSAGRIWLPELAVINGYVLFTLSIFAEKPPFFSFHFYHHLIANPIAG